MDRLVWLKSGLFWRTFILLAFLIALSMAGWVASFQFVERAPRAQQLAAQVVSIVTITRAALTHSAPDLRRELLFELASNEGIRVYPLEDTDQVEPTSDSAWMQLIQSNVRGQLGRNTRFASQVNDVRGFWVSFNIDGDEYWLMLDREKISGTSGVQWIGWATLVLLLSLLGAVFISRRINLPLARLSKAARTIATGRTPDPLPERGPVEIRETNRSFNHMAADLHRIETDRALILAGISHDLRTPITRMQLEVEMAGLAPEARAGMRSDLAQMDAIIGQFLDYARPSSEDHNGMIDLSALVAACAQDAIRHGDVEIRTALAPALMVRGNETDLRRLLNNLLENARRYGKTRDADVARIEIVTSTETDAAVLTVADHGPGVPDADLERLLRPFVRLDEARGQASGAGLGLAIVERIVRRHGGRLRLRRSVHGGLEVTISLPRAA